MRQFNSSELSEKTLLISRSIQSLSFRNIIDLGILIKDCFEFLLNNEGNYDE